MNCKAIQSRLSAYLDRELTGTELLQMRDHISGCFECRNELEELRSLKAMLGGMTSPEPPHDFAARLSAQVLNSKTQNARWTFRKSALTFAGVAAVSMVVTFFVISFQAGPLPKSSNTNMAFDVAQDQSYEVGGDPTMGAPVIPVAHYVGQR